MAESNILRRSLLKRAGGVCAGAVGFPYVIAASGSGSQGQVAASARIVMGCIGVGGQGTHNMQAFTHQPDVQVVAVCDVERASDYYWGWPVGWERAQKIVEDYYTGRSRSGSFKGCGVYGDFRELLARDDIDTVNVCTPDHWHGIISATVARAGQDIYCAKLLTNTFAEGRADAGPADAG